MRELVRCLVVVLVFRCMESWNRIKPFFFVKAFFQLLSLTLLISGFSPFFGEFNIDFYSKISQKTECSWQSRLNIAAKHFPSKYFLFYFTKILQLQSPQRGSILREFEILKEQIMIHNLVLVFIRCVHCFHFCGLFTDPSVFFPSRSSHARMKIKTAGKLTTAIKAREWGGKKRTEIDGLWTSLKATWISFFFLFFHSWPRKRTRLWTGYHFLSLFHLI